MKNISKYVFNENSHLIYFKSIELLNTCLKINENFKKLFIKTKEI